MTERKLIYIASPYAGDVERNMEFARAACRYCIAQGHTPVAVHLLYTQLLNDSIPEERETGLKLGHHVLERCDELWCCGDRISAGMSAEIGEAGKLGKPIRQVPEAMILGAQKPTYTVWAKARTDGPLAGQAGFLCENRKLLTFSSLKKAEVRAGDIRNLCLNNAPAAEFECVEYPDKYASRGRMHLETLRDLDMVPAFDPNNFEIRSRAYGTTGGQCMVGTVQFYLPDLDKSVWVNCNDESVVISSADHVWNEDGSDSWERYEDVCLYSAEFDHELPEDAEPWLPMIKEALAYTIEQETARHSFSLPVVWLPESVRQNAEPEYLDWLMEQGKKISIAEEGRIVIDGAYPQSGQSQTGISPMGL